MPASTLISVQEYLAASYDPDREYVAGELVERNVGNQDHSRVQTLLGAFLVAHESRWGYRALLEQRLRIAPDRYRIPDACLVESLTREKTITSPPALCVEILSPADTMHAMQEKIDDYLGFGVRAVWVINPETRRGWVYTRHGIQEPADGVLRVPGTLIEVPLSSIFDPA
jgi:Uma2 family endonuclease